jgi:ribosomal protein L11 methyltransferase
MKARGDSPGPRWRVLTARVPASLEDEVAFVLGGGSLGVELVPAGDFASVVRVYLGPGDDPAAWRARAQRVLEAHGLDAGDAGLTIDSVEDERWVERWQASLRPIPLGERFVVVPGEDEDAPPGREILRLIPGMAFGTGEHETTRMCAAALERLARPGSRWLDVGTGTGILALVAARCGATRVLAIDIDPEAAHVAGAVVAANGASSAVEVRAGGIEVAGGERFDGAVANVQSSFFLRHAADLADALHPGGAIVLSGILAEDAAEVAAALQGAGIAIEDRSAQGPWGCLVGRRLP